MATIGEIASDREVRSYVSYAHNPEEIYTADGSRVALVCGKCGQGWRCTSRQILDAWIGQHSEQAVAEGLIPEGKS